MDDPNYAVALALDWTIQERLGRECWHDDKNFLFPVDEWFPMVDNRDAFVALRHMLKRHYRYSFKLEIPAGENNNWRVVFTKRKDGRKRGILMAFGSTPAEAISNGIIALGTHEGRGDDK